MTHDVIIQKMHEGLFKPNCALGSFKFAVLLIALILLSVLIDLLIRLGYITPDNEPDFMKILTRLHGTFDFERW